MATRRLSAGLLLGIVFLAGLGSARPAAAGFVVNGDFSSQPNGLTGWSYSDPALVSVVDGQARLQEPTFDLSVTLWQDIVLTAGDQTLTFQLLDFTTEAETFGGLPDAFNVGLLDTVTDESLVDTVLLADGSSSKSYYSRDLVHDQTGQAVPSQWAATGVTVTPLAGGVETISLDVSSLVSGLQVGEERTVRLMFGLHAGSEFQFDASVTLDGVAITGTGGGDPPDGPPPVVPAPASVVLVLSGCPALLGVLALRRRGGRGPQPAAPPA
jgi:hypothetical protein